MSISVARRSSARAQYVPDPRAQLVVNASLNRLQHLVKRLSGHLPAEGLAGFVLRAIATAARSSVLWALRSVPFGKYCRSSPLVFSFVPRCPYKRGLL